MRAVTRKWLIAISVMMGVSMNAGAGLFGFGGESWKEEVLLHDGRKIIVERSVERGGRHEIGQEPPIKEQSLTFIMPGTNENVVWEDKFTADVGGANFFADATGNTQRDSLFGSRASGMLVLQQMGSAQPPYVVFKYQDKAWRRIALQELPEEFKIPNLIFSSPDNEAKKTGQRIVSAQTIKKLYEGYKQPQYQTILREPLKPGSLGVSCLEMIPYGKGGWLGLDWFSNQPTYEACIKFCDKKGVNPENCPCETLFKRK